MTDLIEKVLSNMSEKFNQPSKIVEINLNDDKTLKWRGLHNNQYAAAKRKKDGTKQRTVRSKSNCADDPPPLMNDSGNSSSIVNGSGVAVGSNNNNNSSCSSTSSRTTIASTRKLIETNGNNLADDAIDGADDDDDIDNGNIGINHLNDKDIKTDNMPPLRRTLRRKVNTIDDQIDDNLIQNIVGKKSMRSKRQQINSESSIETGSTMSNRDENTNDSIVTRRRGRARKFENESDEILTIKSVHSIDDGSNDTQNVSMSTTSSTSSSVAQPPQKLRRSERMHGSAASLEQQKDVTSLGDTIDNDDGTNAAHDHNMTIDISATVRKTRKRTIDDKKPLDLKDEIITLDDTIPNEVKKCEEKIENETVIAEIKANNETLPKEEIDYESNGDPGGSVGPRKRGRKPGSKLKTKADLKVNMTIATRNSPIKKSPRFSSDESPFTYSIPKKDKTEQPQPRLSRRIKPTPKILANEELRQGFENQNNARLSNSSEHLDNENDRSPRREISTSQPLPITPQTSIEVAPSKSESESSVIVYEEKRQSSKRSPSATPPKHQAASPIDAQELMKAIRRPCPDPEKFLNEIKMAKINLNRSPEDNKNLNGKQKKRLNKLKERHLHKLGLQRVSKSNNESSSSEFVASDDNDEFIPTKKVNVSRPSVTLRVRGQKDIVIYNKHISAATKAAREKAKKLVRRQTQPVESNHRRSPSKLLDRLDHHSKELISRNPEISLISSTKHKPSSDKRFINNIQNGGTTQLTSEVTLSIRKDSSSILDPNICLCKKTSKYYTRKTDETFCSAIDEIENQKVGCGHEVNGELLNLLRPSIRVSYMLLCDSHKKRLHAHNCCAGCGVFCTQGKFVICSKNHFFHRDCAEQLILNAPYDPNNPNYACPSLVLKCPHCGVDATDNEVMISMRCGSIPIFTTAQKRQIKPARMTIGAHSYQSIKTRNESYLLDIEKLVPDTVEAILVRAQNHISFTENRTFTSKDVFYAVTKDDIDRMAEIIASGFDITTPIKEFHDGTCLHLVANFGSTTMTYLIISRVSSIDFFNHFDNKLRTAIMCSIYGKRNDILKLLIQCGADVTIKGIDGMTALHLAAKLSNYEAMQIILDGYCASTNQTQLNKFINATDEGGWTALMWSADMGSAEMVSVLLKCGANVNVCDAENFTALHWAAQSDNIETVMLFLQNGETNLATQNISGDTPLHIACRNGNSRMSLYMLAHGANLDITNNANEAPYDCIPDENGPCGRAIFFNLQIRNITGLPESNILSQDISNGREAYPIQIVSRKKYRNSRPSSVQSENENDEMIPDFKYITKSILLQNSIQIDHRVFQMRICSCLDDCTSSNCHCGEISIQNWYSSEGRLISNFNFSDPAMIFECNDICGCNKLMCKNRVVQSGAKTALQVFECVEREKGFGVRGVTEILRGTFIAEYTGEILTDMEADRRNDDSYFFDLGASEHCIDANFYGNVSRFFNHSCEPNMVPIRVYFDHQDLRFPKIAFFAIKDIDAGQELTFDYGEKFWITKYKQFTCHCGTPSCRFSDKTIAKTLSEYNQRN